MVRFIWAARKRFSEALNVEHVGPGDIIELEIYGTLCHAVYLGLAGWERHRLGNLMHHDPEWDYMHWMFMFDEVSPRLRDGAVCSFVRVVSRVSDATG